MIMILIWVIVYWLELRLIQRVQNMHVCYCFVIPPRCHITHYLNRSNLMIMKSGRSPHFSIFKAKKSLIPF